MNECFKEVRADKVEFWQDMKERVLGGHTVVFPITPKEREGMITVLDGFFKLLVMPHFEGKGRCVRSEVDGQIVWELVVGGKRFRGAVLAPRERFRQLSAKVSAELAGSAAAGLAPSFLDLTLDAVRGKIGFVCAVIKKERKEEFIRLYKKHIETLMEAMPEMVGCTVVCHEMPGGFEVGIAGPGIDRLVGTFEVNE